MRQRLDAKQFTPLTSEERNAIRQAAEDRGISNGLLSRALLLYAFDEHLTSPGVIARVEDEKAASRQRISEGARAAISARYGSEKGEEE